METLPDNDNGPALLPLSTRIRNGVFTVAAQINEDLSIHPFWAALLMVVDAVQMLSFPLNPDPKLPFYNQPLMRSLWQALQPVFFQPSPSPRGWNFPVTYHAGNIFLVAAVWTLALALLYAFAAYLAMQEDDPVNDYKAYRPRWPSQILRTCLRITHLALFIPVMTSLLEPLNCTQGSYWSNTSLLCFSDLHAFYLALSVFVAPIAFALAIGSAAALIDRRPDHKRNLLSQPHGRISMVMVLLKMALCLIFNFSLNPSITDLFPLVTALGAGLVWLVAYARYLPFHQQWLNELQCGLAGVYVSACVAALLSTAQVDPASSIGTYTFLFTAPPAAFVGWALALMSRNSFSGRRELASPYAVEIKARAMLAELAAEEANSGGSSLGSLGLAQRRDSGGAGAGTGPTGNGSASVQLSDMVARKRDIQLLYDDASGVFSASALLELFAATYLGTVMRNRHLENVHLRAALAKADASAFDIKFFVWERYARLEADEAASNTVRTSVIRRLQFDTLQAESEKLCMKLRALVLDFWTECCEKRPDMSRMQTIGIDIIANIRRCENVYKQMMELSPGSAAVMRAYAEFLLEIANNPKQALELLQLAEQIEEEESKAHGTDNDTADYPLMSTMPDFDLSHESVSLLRIDGSPGRIGVIVDVNNAALKLFGYTRREILGRNINELVPEPMSTPHDKFLRRYIETGEERVVNTSRIYYGLHKAGYVFPMCANVRPMENGFGAVFESITTSQAYVVFMGEAARWKVTAACKTSMALLNLAVDDLRAGHVSMDRLLPTLMEGLPTAMARNKIAMAAQLADMGGAGDEVHDDETAGLLAHAGYAGGAGGHGANGNSSYATLGSFGNIAHSPIMNELINAAGQPGPGIDVALSVIDWRKALAAQSKAARRQSMMAAHSMSIGRLGNMGSPRDVGSLGGPGQGITAAEVAAAFVPTKTILATAKLQELPLAFIPTPVYVLRWRLAKGDDPHGSAAGGADADDSSSISSGDSNAVQGSQDGDQDDMPKQTSPNNRSHANLALPLNRRSSEGRSSFSNTLDRVGMSAQRRPSLLLSQAAGNQGLLPLAPAPAPVPAPAPAPVPVPSTPSTGGQPKSAMKQGQPQPQVQVGTGRRASTGGGDAMAQRRGSVSFGSPKGTMPGNKAQGTGQAVPDLPGAVPSPGEEERPPQASISPESLALGPLPDPSRPSQAEGEDSSGRRATNSDGDPHSPRPGSSARGSEAGKPPAPIHGAPEDEQEDEELDGSGKFANLNPRGSFRTMDGRSAGQAYTADQRLEKKASKGRIKWSTGPDEDIAGQGATEVHGDRAQPFTGLDLPVAKKQHGTVRHIPSSHSRNDAHDDADRASAHSGGRGSALMRPLDHAEEAGSKTHHKAKSAASGSSAGSSHVTDALRKGISMRSRDMEGSLVALRRALILVFLVVGAVNIASTTVTTQLFSQLVKATDFVATNGERGIALQRAYAEIEQLRYIAEGAVDVRGQEHHVTDAKALLSESLEKLDSLHRELYVSSTEGSSASTAAADLWKTPFVHIQDAVTDEAGLAMWYGPSNYSYSNRSINLGDAGLEFIIKGRQIYRTDVANLTMRNPLVFWVMSNGPIPIRDAFNASMLTAQALTEGQAGTVFMVNIIVLAVALGLQAVMVAFVMLPALRKVIRQKSSVFNVFLGTPLVILRSLRQKTDDKINKMRRAAEEAEAGMDIAGAGDVLLEGDGAFDGNLPAGRLQYGHDMSDGDSSSAFDHRQRPVDPTLAAAAASVANKTNSSNSHTGSKTSGLWSWTGSKSNLHAAEAGDGKAAKAHHHGPHKSKRAFRSTTASLLDGRVIRFLLPMLVLVAYYYGTYVWKQSVVSTSEYYKSEVFYANQVAFMVGQSDYNIRNMVSNCEAAFVEDQSNRLSTLLSTLQSLQDGLLYGDPVRKLRPLLKESKPYFALMMENGCLASSANEGRYTYDECAGSNGFFEGLVGRGLQAALKEYIQLALRVRDARLAAVLNPSTCRIEDYTEGSLGITSDLASRFLAIGLHYAAHLTVESTTASLASFMTMDISITVASIAGLLLFFFGIYNPLIRRMDQEIKNVRHLLLLYPDEISSAVPAIINAGRELLKDGHSSSNSSAISGP